MIKKCKTCGKEFKTIKSRIENGRGKYCSLKCRNQTGLLNPNWKGIKKQKKCLYCGKIFITKKDNKLCSIKCRGKYMSGSNCPSWKGGITPINIKIRQSKEYKLWREAVFKRDNYTCIWCGQVGGKLNADHIKPFALYPELRFAIDNGRTLCIECHKKTPSYLNRWFKNNKTI